MDEPATCRACAQWEMAGAPDCSRCARLVDAIVDEGWQRHREARGLTGSAAELQEAARVVAQPDRFAWRVVDAALDRLTCESCGARLTTTVGCRACDVAHGFRYAAIEIDRPAVPPGNEHALRVNVSVLRRPAGVSREELLARRVLVPLLAAGLMPSTRDAQQLGALVKRGATDTELARAAWAALNTARK